ncbi:AGAP004345-PA-like protein [Anopheles sinensis]|uniref:AGAP004345-PA-like protein n=1 Tax=Anopheles sinensis TaxID=74873 RepID=A0A084WQ86_ANOSI|nr:AGAP004345-PA-like protein [Anopheles sinensis]
MENTPKKRHLETVESILTKEAITKSGRKVRRPAHLDSPERSPVSPVVEAKKSAVRKTKTFLDAVAASPAKATSGKSALTEAEDSSDDVKESRKPVSSARKTISSLAATPKKSLKKETAAVDDSGISKSGRKIKVPSKLIDFESEILLSPRKATEESKGTAKTPGRPSRSAKKRTANEDIGPNSEDETVPARIGRGKSLAAKESGRSVSRKTTVPDDSDSEATSSRTASPAPVAPKTPGRRAKSVASALAAESVPQSEEMNTANNKTGRTPGRPSTKPVSKVTAAAEKSSPQKEETNTVSVKTGRTPGRPSTKSVTKLSANNPEVVASPNLSRKTAPSTTTENEADKDDTTGKIGRTPGRPVGKPSMKQHLDSPAPASLKPNVPRGRSYAPQILAPESENEPKKDAIQAGKTPGRTPGRRAVKSLMPSAVSAEDNGALAGPKISEDSNASTHDTQTGAALSRSGRKLKPKRFFEIDQVESSGKQAVLDGTDSSEGARKRKVDSVDESADVGEMMSPRKKMTTDKLASSSESQTDTEVAKLVLLKPAQKAVTDNEKSTTGSAMTPSKRSPKVPQVSRSGRKIKVKQITGFEYDGATDLPEAKATDVTQSKQNKATSSGASSAPIDDDDIEAHLHSFVTKRGVDDHHHKQHVSVTDEPDRAVTSGGTAEPLELPTSRVSPRTVKKSLASVNELSEKQNIDNSSLTNQSAGVSETTPPETIGSSRSGRKIKPKKFYDDDDDEPNAGGGQVGKARAAKETKKSIANLSAASTRTVEEHSGADVAKSHPRSPIAMDTGVDVAEGPSTVASQVEKGESSMPETDVQRNNELAEPESKHEVATDVVEDSAGTISSAPVIGKSVGQHPNISEKPELEQTSDVSLSMTTSCEKPSEGEPSSENVSKIEPMDVDKTSESNLLIPDADGDEVVEQQNVTADVVASVAVTISPTMEKDTQRKLPRDIQQEKRPAAIGVRSIFPVEDGDLLADCSLGEIEYLEDEVQNVVEHVKHPPATGNDRVAVPSIRIIPETPAANEKEKLHVNVQQSPTNGNDPDAGSSVWVIPETPASNEKEKLDETFDVTIDESPKDGEQPLSNSVPEAAAPHTPSAIASTRDTDNKCSPDKAPEIIEILDSPAAMAFCQQIDAATTAAPNAGGSGSATSTPLAMKMVQDRGPLKERAVTKLLLHEGRKRSLSASEVDTTIKRNVTFHSPANSTVLVNEIDERLVLKSFQQKQEETAKSATKRTGPRKRSMSEHKPAAGDVKPSKICRKVPNFKNIHANHFDRMESIADFMRRKDQRAKEILTSASPATKLLARPAAGTLAVKASDEGPSKEKKAPAAQKPFIFKASGASVPLFGKPTAAATAQVPQQRAHPKATNIVRPVLTAASRVVRVGQGAARQKVASPSSNTNRLQQYQAAFKSKQQGTTEVPQSTSVAPVPGTSSTRPIEQLRTKQSKLLKGVRTNRRFELQMKHRDNNPQT